MLKKKKTIARIIAYMICACMLGGMVQTIPKVDAIDVYDTQILENAVYCESLEEAALRVRNTIYDTRTGSFVFPYPEDKSLDLIKSSMFQ